MVGDDFTRLRWNSLFLIISFAIAKYSEMLTSTKTFFASIRPSCSVDISSTNPPFIALLQIIRKQQNARNKNA